MTASIHRRDFLLSAAALAASTLRGQESAGAGIGLRFATDQAALSRMLPPGFEAGAESEVKVEFAADGAWAGVFVGVRYGETEGWMPVAFWTSSDRTRFVARERLGVGASHADITVVDGSGKVSVNGEAVLEVAVGQGPGEPAEAEERPLLLVRFSAHEDWTQGEPAGNGQVVESAWPSARKTRLDQSTATLKWLRTSPSEPASELPVVDVLSAWSVATAVPLGTDQTEPRIVASIPSDDLEPWMPLRYRRPSLDGAIRRPEGWPNEATAMRWTDAESRRWKSREEIRFDPVELIEINAVIAPEVHASLLPPPCIPGSSPLVKIMGVRFGAVAEQPVNELWLMAYCRIGRVSAWYTISHIVGPGGDLSYGREAFGYPTKFGQPSVVVTPIDCSLVGHRKGRDFFFAEGAFGGFTTGTSIGRFNIVSLRARPGQRTGELILQPWTYQGRRQEVTEMSANLSVPDMDSSETSVRLDPWFELRPLQLGSISVIETGLMQRHPGQTVGVVEHPDAFYRERCDGVLPWEPDPAQQPQPSLS